MPKLGNTVDEFGRKEPEFVSFTKRAIEMESLFDLEDTFGRIEKRLDNLKSMGTLDFKWENFEIHQLVTDFIERFTYEKLSEYMPNWGNDFFATIKISTALCNTETTYWPGDGITNEDRKAAFFELWKLITSSEFAQIQAEKAASRIGSRAYQSMIEFRVYSGLNADSNDYKFRDFSFWYEIYKQQPELELFLGDTYYVDLNKFFDDQISLYNFLCRPDFYKNCDLWFKGIRPGISYQTGAPLLKVAVQLSPFSSFFSDGKPLMRLGILATGTGYWCGKKIHLVESEKYV